MDTNDSPGEHILLISPQARRVTGTKLQGPSAKPPPSSKALGGQAGEAPTPKSQGPKKIGLLNVINCATVAGCTPWRLAAGRPQPLLRKRLSARRVVPPKRPARGSLTI